MWYDLLMTSLTGSLWRAKRMGPKTDPWGTPRGDRLTSVPCSSSSTKEPVLWVTLCTHNMSTLFWHGMWYAHVFKSDERQMNSIVLLILYLTVYPAWGLLSLKPHICAHDSAYHRNSLEEFFDERRLSSFHFLFPFLSGLGFNSSHLSNGESMIAGHKDKIQLQTDWFDIRGDQKEVVQISWTVKLLMVL